MAEGRSVARIGVLAIVVGLVTSGCASFRGIGELRPQGTDAPASNVKAAPAESGDSQDWGTAKAGPAFDWPVDEARVSRGFKAARKAHWGIDLANVRGTRILSAERGRVIYVGKQFRGYGNLVVIEHDEEWATLYAHLDKFLVSEGQQVEQGQPVGLMGRTGRASGVHLHFEMRRNRAPVNPLSFLPQGF